MKLKSVDQVDIGGNNGERSRGTSTMNYDDISLVITSLAKQFRWGEMTIHGTIIYILVVWVKNG